MSKATIAVVSLLMVTDAGALPVSLQAQVTAHFNGPQNPVGSGLASPGGVAVDGRGNVYIADSSDNRVLLETVLLETYSQSTIISGLTGAQGVAGDGGNVYIADGAGAPPPQQVVCRNHVVVRRWGWFF